MLGKIRLYVWTIRYMKPAQIIRRVSKKFGIGCALRGAAPAARCEGRHSTAFPELDFDPVFLKRYSVDALMEDRVTFLYETEAVSWEGNWQIEDRSPLWNFNLHYFEYIQPLAARYLETGDERYLEKTLQMIRGWICSNPRQRGGTGWAAYPVSLRLTNWMSYMAAVGDRLNPAVREELEASMLEQYAFLSTHLEKDILGNHYFENLKTLVLCALYFGDRVSLEVFLKALRQECREEILPDGMHFELSPMYHKIVLEGLLRVTAALREAELTDRELEDMVQNMLNAAASMEAGLSCTPLFNDSGDNVAKSLDALLLMAERRLGMLPVSRQVLPDSGYYFFSEGPWRLIVDAGKAGPDYIPGHSHCDAMSFELYREGKPWLVNCGTYAYQCRERGYFRSTRAHNTVQITDTEQSEIWSTFRLARRSRTKVLELRERGLRMEMTDYRGNRIRRDIQLNADSLCICDRASGKKLQSHLHSLSEIQLSSNVPVVHGEALYAPEYGRLHTIHHMTAEGSDCVELKIRLP